VLVEFKNQFKHMKMKKSWEKAIKNGPVDPRIPPQNINYNMALVSSFEEYRTEFIKNACLKELPALLNIANYNDGTEDFSILDYGCGLGRLGYAFTSFFGEDPKRNYYGYEIHPDAFNFLTQAYKGFANTHFFTDQILLEESYVEIGQKKQSSLNEKDRRIRPDEIKLRSHIKVKVDLQFTHSVFTHMLRPSIVHVLKEVSSVLKTDGVCVNTWLIVDKFSASSVNCGLADRTLPFELDGFLTYSKENPLVCSAYRLETIKEIYAQANHEILDVKWGTWSGRSPTQNFTYQDVVISRPMK